MMPSNQPAPSPERKRVGFRNVSTKLVRSLVAVALVLWACESVVLASMLIPAISRGMQRSKESVLRNNLTTLRQVLDKYCYDKAKCPQNLQDLVTGGYLQAIPPDPMNGNSTDWQKVLEDATNSVNQQQPGIWDVRSLASKTGLDGRPYSEW